MGGASGLSTKVRTGRPQNLQESAAPHPRRFLFLFSDTGGGHRAAAQAVKEELERLHGDSADVEMLDIFVALDRWPFHRFPEWYPASVGLSGIPWGAGYRLSNSMSLVKGISKLLWPYTCSPLCDLLIRHPADVIASFHPIPNYTLFMALRRLGWRIPAMVVVLDMVTVHAGWFAPGAELYTVPTYAAKARALRWAVPEDRLQVTGMPTRRSFVSAMDLPQAQARAQLHLPPHEPVVLIVGGAEGMGPLGQIVRAVTLQRPAAHIVIVTGRNRALYDQLVSTDLLMPVQVEGFVSNMHVWMRAADLLVTKAGPNTLAEAFIAGLPIVLYTALPGQETGNVAHVVENGAGVWAPSPRLAAREVMHLLAHPQERLEMARRSRFLARPLATEQIARALWRLTPSRQGAGELPKVATGLGTLQRAHKLRCAPGPTHPR